MNKKFLIWMILLLVLSSGVIAADLSPVSTSEQQKLDYAKQLYSEGKINADGTLINVEGDLLTEGYDYVYDGTDLYARAQTLSATVPASDYQKLNSQTKAWESDSIDKTNFAAAVKSSQTYNVGLTKTSIISDPQDVTAYKAAIKNYETVDAKLSTAGKTERVNLAVDAYIKENPKGTEEDFYTSGEYDAYKEEETKLNLEKTNYKKEIIKLEKTKAVQENLKAIQAEAAAEKKAVVAAAADKKSVSKSVSSKFKEIEKTNTYEIGGDKYLKVAGEDNVFTKVGAKGETEYYAFDEDNAKLLKEYNAKPGITVKSNVQPVKFNEKTMTGDADDETTWKYIDDKKLNGDKAGKDFEVPTSTFNAQMGTAADEYSKNYGTVTVIPSERGHTITVSTAKTDSKDSKTSKERGKVGDSNWLSGLLGSDKNKEIVAERGSYIYGSDVYATQSWETTGDKVGEFKGTTFSKIKRDADGKVITDDKGNVVREDLNIKMSAYGNLEGDLSGLSKEEREAIEKTAASTKFNHWVGGLQKAQAWSSISSLFGLDLTEWKQTVDEIFHSMFLGSDYWAEAICYQTTDLPDLEESSIFAYDSDGNLMQTATIVATKQVINMQNGTKYLYKVSFYVRNPENAGNKEQGFSSGSSSSSSSSTASGLLARGEMGGTTTGGLDKQEKEFFNVIKKGAKEISNTKSKTSRTGTDEDMEFNVELSGEKTIYLFETNEELSPGDESIYTKEDAVASYSAYNYDKACIVFEGEKPRNLFYEEVDEICADVIDISGESSTNLPYVSSGSSGSSGRETIGSEFSSSSSGSSGFTK